MPDWMKYIREHLPRDGFRGELEGEILEELAGHLEDAYAEALSRGVLPEEAEARVIDEIQDWEALARNILRSRRGVKESRTGQALEASEIRIRERGGGWVPLADSIQELRLTYRRLRKAPAFTLVALLTLAIGIGATTAIFSVVKGVLLDPLPYEDAHELVWVGNAAPGMGEELNFQSLAFNAVYEDEGRSFRGCRGVDALESFGHGDGGTSGVLGCDGHRRCAPCFGSRTDPGPDVHLRRHSDEFTPHHHPLPPLLGGPIRGRSRSAGANRLHRGHTEGDHRGHAGGFPAHGSGPGLLSSPAV